jgi:hypothetical protein
MIKHAAKQLTKYFAGHMITLVIVLIPTLSMEQAVAASGNRFHLTFGGSRVWTLASTWSDQVETSLTVAGLDETDPGGCSWFGCRDPEVRPVTKWVAHESFWIAAGVRVGRRFEIRARFAARGKLGTTVGHSFDWSDTTSCSYDLYINPSLTVWSASIMYRLHKGLWIGIGPTLTAANIKYESFVDSRTPTYSIYIEDKISKQVPGAVVELAYRLPIRSWLFAEAGGQYYLTPETTIGPIAIIQEDGTVGREMPATDLNLSWGQIGFGVGVAF